MSYAGSARCNAPPTWWASGRLFPPSSSAEHAASTKTVDRDHDINVFDECRQPFGLGGAHLDRREVLAHRHGLQHAVVRGTRALGRGGGNDIGL